MKLIPLQQWLCDDCHQIIEQPKDGWLEWLALVTVAQFEVTVTTD